jgi:hypothetical protein
VAWHNPVVTCLMEEPTVGCPRCDSSDVEAFTMLTVDGSINGRQCGRCGHMLESNRSARCVCDACFDEDREGVAAAMAANGATPDQIAGRVRRAP